MLAPALTTALAERNRRTFSRITTERASLDTLISRAEYLPANDRTLLLAHYHHGIPLDELASLHHISRRQLRRKLDTLRNTLSDPSFLLTVRFGKRLPKNLLAFARGCWIESIPLRTLARQHNESLHKVRQQLAQAQSLLHFFAQEAATN
jgi:AraC-like DNA-binding protein